MSMKPRLEQDNKGIEHLVTQPMSHPGEEETYDIPNTCSSSKKPTPNQRLTPNAVSAPKTHGN
jgi:hypothetical protein